MAKNNEGWINWKGGDCPVKANDFIEVQFRCGDVSEANKGADEYDWLHYGGSGDIVAYRISTHPADRLHRAAIKLLDELTHAYVADEAKAELRAAINAYEASK